MRRETIMIEPARLGWVAAILEMKGRVDYIQNKTRATPQVRLVVQSKNIAMISRLAEMTGGKPENRPGKAVKDWMQRPCAEHCPKPHVHHEAGWRMPDMKSWSVTGAACAIVIHNVRPYLLKDSPHQWDKVYEALKGQAVLKGRGAGATQAAVRRLAGLGWDIPREFVAVMERVAGEEDGTKTAKGHGARGERAPAELRIRVEGSGTGWPREARGAEGARRPDGDDGAQQGPRE